MRRASLRLSRFPPASPSYRPRPRSDPAGGVEMLETALNRLMQMEFSGTAPAGTTAYTTRFIANLATLMNRH